MTQFDFSNFNFFGNNVNNTSKKRADKQRRGRQCRIEELEGREMLSVSPWTIANDPFDYSDTVLVDTGNVDSGQSELVAPLKATGEPVGTIGNAKVAVDKAYTSANTIGLSIAKGAGVAGVINGYKVSTTQGNATGLSYVTEKGKIVTHDNYDNLIHGTIKASSLPKSMVKHWKPAKNTTISWSLPQMMPRQSSPPRRPSTPPSK
jgi:hypothetical protein